MYQAFWNSRYCYQGHNDTMLDSRHLCEETFGVYPVSELALSILTFNNLVSTKCCVQIKQCFNEVNRNYKISTRYEESRK